MSYSSKFPIMRCPQVCMVGVWAGCIWSSSIFTILHMFMVGEVCNTKSPLASGVSSVSSRQRSSFPLLGTPGCDSSSICYQQRFKSCHSSVGCSSKSGQCHPAVVGSYDLFLVLMEFSSNPSQLLNSYFTHEALIHSCLFNNLLFQ